MVGLALSKDPESYTGSSIAPGRAYHAGQFKRDDPDEMGYPGPPGWGLCLRLPTSPHEKVHVEKTSEMPREK